MINILNLHIVLRLLVMNVFIALFISLFSVSYSFGLPPKSWVLIMGKTWKWDLDELIIV